MESLPADLIVGMKVTKINQCYFVTWLIPMAVPAKSADECTQGLRSGCNEPCPIERGMRLLGGKWKARSCGT